MQPIYWNGCAVYFAWIFIYHFSIYPNIVNDSLSYQWSFGNLTDVTLVDEDGYSMQVDDLYYGDVVVDSFDKFNQLATDVTAFTSCWQFLPAAKIFYSFYQLSTSLFNLPSEPIIPNQA